MFSDDFFKAGSGLFVKMTAGDKEVGVFAGDPLEYMTNFDLKTDYPLGLPHYPDKTRPQFKINFVSKVDGKFITRVLQGNKQVADRIKKNVAKFGKDYMYELSCESTGKSFNGRPVNEISVLPERPLAEDERGQLAAVELIPLKLQGETDKTNG